MKLRARIRITRYTSGGELATQLAGPMGNLGNAVGRRMQRLVPKRTWRLHDTIRRSDPVVRGSKVSVEVAAGGQTVRGRYVNYELHVERGTSKMAAQPFMRPALLQSTDADLLFEGELAGQKGGA